MGTTRTAFLVTAAVALALVVAAAGIGAYVAVRRNAAAPPAPAADPLPATRPAAAPLEIAARSAGGGTNPEPGVAVESTEQTVAAASPPAAAEPRPVETRRTRPTRDEPAARPEPEPPRAAARPPAPAPRAPAPPRREPPRPEPAERIARAEPRPAAAAPRPEPESTPETAAPAERRAAARANRDLPEIEGWRPADPLPTAAPEAETRNGSAARDAPPPALADLDASPPAFNDLDPPGGRGSGPALAAAEELLIPADSVIGLQIDTFVTTDHAEVEDDVTARVTRDVTVARRVAIPAGSVVNGSVVLVERGGQLRGTARLGVRFHTVVLDDGGEVPIATETVYREGGSRGRDNAAKIGGGAVAGAILGAIFGGGRGAAIGGAAGAAGGTAAAAAGDAEAATLPAGATLTVRLSRPSSVSVPR